MSVLEVAYERTANGNRGKRLRKRLRLPIFDWGTARVAVAELTYMQAVNRAADIAVRARSEVRESYNAYRTAFDWPATTGKRSFRSAGAFPKRTCFATTACSSACSSCSPMRARKSPW